MKNELNRQVGELLKRMRLEAGLSVETVFEKTDRLSLSDLTQIESGQVSIRCYDLVKLIELYQPSEELLFHFCTCLIRF